MRASSSRCRARSGSRCWRWSSRSCSACRRRWSSTASFPLRGVLRTIFVMPMMATPVAIALVWTMMFHPQLGVLNYLLSLVGIAALSLGLRPRDRDPDAGPGRGLALDAAGHADRARRAGGLADRPLRLRADRRRHIAGRCSATSRCRCLALHHDRGGDPHHRCAEGLRHHLRDHPGRAGNGVGDAQHLPLSAGLPVLQYRLRLGGGGRSSSSSSSRCRCCCSTCGRRRSGTRDEQSRPVGALASISRVGFALSPSFCWSRRRSSSSSGCCRSRFKNEVDNTAFPPVFIPSPPTLENYRRRVREEQLPALSLELASWSPAARC